MLNFKFNLNFNNKLFENCFIENLEESLDVSLLFKAKFEAPWRKLIQYIFKKYTDGMSSEEMCEDFLSELFKF